MPYKDKEKERMWIEKNKERRKKYKAEWHQKNKERRNAENKKRREEFREWYFSLKRGKKCEICGYDKHFSALDFHHKNAELKESSIADLITKTTNKQKILEEVEKCIIVCANCHRELHYNKKYGA
ncbi:hypothetical protein CL614_00160 [archaeon]|nr:hypothetical protein [archaeon]|tara:strand:- start:680 stop:1054 length:375 start_codon:yes stop_codon:yes gene_type:complete